MRQLYIAVVIDADLGDDFNFLDGLSLSGRTVISNGQQLDTGYGRRAFAASESLVMNHTPVAARRGTGSAPVLVSTDERIWS